MDGNSRQFFSIFIYATNSILVKLHGSVTKLKPAIPFYVGLSAQIHHKIDQLINLFKRKQ